MFKTAIRLLLAVQLAACPVFCGMLSSFEASHEQAVPARSDACPDSCQALHDTADLHQDTPAPPSECPCKNPCPCKNRGQDCICSGALVKPTDLELSIVTHPFACLPEPAEPIASDRKATPGGFLYTGCLPASDGRSVRVLICSLLC